MIKCGLLKGLSICQDGKLLCLMAAAATEMYGDMVVMTFVMSSPKCHTGASQEPQAGRTESAGQNGGAGQPGPAPGTLGFGRGAERHERGAHLAQRDLIFIRRMC